MRKLLYGIIFVSILFAGCNQSRKQNASEITAEKTAKEKSSGDAVIPISDEQFKKLVFNYDVDKTWKYLGNKPCIIDFYATWCGPCKMMSPRLEEVARQYAGKLVVYKVDTDKEKQLSASLGIQSLPTIVFIPQDGKPQASIGVMPQESLEKAIHEVLLVR